MLVAAGCGANGGNSRVAPDPAPQVAFVLDDASFDQPPRSSMVAFDVVSSDMDGDGDPDVLVNWHNLAPLELFENVAGSFTLRNPDARDRSGVFENPGVARLYADEQEMVDRVRRKAVPGVFIWHDPNPRDDWQVYVVPAQGPVKLTLRANRALAPQLDDRFVLGSDEFGVDLEIDTELHFRVGVPAGAQRLIATELAAAASVPIFAGADLSPSGEEVRLWKDDPHGIAWVHVRGSAQPEIFITRGGLAGALVPPLEPKTDRFFEYTDGELLYADRRDLIPAGYGRGRRVEWVDVDGDGANELYIGNTATPNTILSNDGAGAYVDVAPQLGLDVVAGDTFAWFDVDDNGLDDLVFIDDAGFVVAYNRGRRMFDIGSGDEIGLRLPDNAEPRGEEALDTGDTAADLFSALALRVVDFDNDGRLDLWLSGYGEQRGHALYRRTGTGFVDVTREVGLDAAPLTNNMVLLDIENDGFVDALIVGSAPMWLHNRGGSVFELEEVDAGWGLREFTHGVAVDVDGDALLDVVLAGHRRMVARNATRFAGGALRVLPRAAAGDPVGAVVTAWYAGGTARAQRYGSALTTRYSQGLAPLHFGIPVGETIERLVVRWPDGEVEERDVRPGEQFIELLH